MIARLGNERVFQAFLDGSSSDFIHAFGKRTISPHDISARFGMTNLFEAMASSAHWARWRAIGMKWQRAGGEVVRRIGFSVEVGRSETPVEVHYFPRIRGRVSDYPIQHADLSVWGGDAAQSDEQVRVHNVRAVLRNVQVIGKSLKFTGAIPLESHRIVPALWIEQVPDGDGAFRFSLGERVIPIGKRNPRHGFSDTVMFPGFGLEVDDEVLEFREAPADNFA